MSHVTEAEAFRACRTLFGPELHLNKDFLTYLQPSGVRSAYRKKAKIIHPDRFIISGATTIDRQNRLFQDLNQAHQTVQNYLKQKKHQGTTRPAQARSSHAQTQRPETARKQQYRQFSLPPRPMQFGQFLYYLGIVPFSALVSAITWQRQQRPALGQIAQNWGWLNEHDIQRIINYRNGFQRFGERAEQLGLLNSRQVGTLLFYQRSKQQQIGSYFVNKGFLNETTMNQLLTRLAEHNNSYRKGFGRHYYYYHR